MIPSRVQATGATVITAGSVAAANPWWDPTGAGLCIWSAYQPKGAANFAASLVDLSLNGNNAGDPGGAATPGWGAATGWTFDGIAQYLTTTFVPQNDQSQSVLIQYTNLTYVEQRNVFGMTDGANRAFSIETRSLKFRYWNGDDQYGSAIPVAGNVGIAGNVGYLDGVADTGAIPAWAGAATFPSFIGCFNQGGAAQRYITAYIQALAIYDCTLTAPQVAAVANAMAAL